jgi:hypothetical protein
MVKGGIEGRTSPGTICADLNTAAEDRHDGSYQRHMAYARDYKYQLAEFNGKIIFVQKRVKR